MQVETSSDSSDARNDLIRFGIGAGLCIVGGIIGMVIWNLVSEATGYFIPVLAMVVGGLCGLGMMFGYGKAGNVLAGLTSAILALAIIIGGNYYLYMPGKVDTSDLQGPSARSALTVIKWSESLDTDGDLDMKDAAKKVKNLDDATVEAELKTHYAKTRREELQASILQSKVDAKLKEMGKTEDDIEEDAYYAMYDEFETATTAEVEKLGQDEIDRRVLSLKTRDEVISKAAENEAAFYFLSNDEDVDDAKHSELTNAARPKFASMSDLELNEYNQRADLVNTATLMSKIELISPLVSVFNFRMIKAMIIWLCAAVGIAYSLPYKAGFRE